MIVAKSEMKEKPTSCWNCDFIHENRNRFIVCSLTGECLYPINVEKVLDECPLMEVEDIK